jgi:cytochrome c oxidase assembly factor 6
MANSVCVAFPFNTSSRHCDDRRLHIIFVMGWFAGNEKPQEESVSTRQDRAKCWETRDAYFSCLDRVGVVKAGEEGTACAAELKSYEKNCAKSWVRVMECVRFLQYQPVLCRLTTSTNGE